MHNFFNNNEALLLDNPELAEAFQNIMILKKYQKHEIIHKAGTICSHFHIVFSGIARVFYFKEDKDITVHFASEQESITAIDSLIQRTRSKYSIEALEELQVFSININDLETLFEKEPKYERFGRLFLQQIYIELVSRIDDLQLHSTKERYDILLTKKPLLFKRVASKHIASFLGMSAETFSRIRTK